MLKSRYTVLLIAQIVVMALLIGLPSFAQDNPPFEYTDTTDPENTLAAYFNAISLKDYSRAYGYWQNPPDDATLQEFAAGFSDTESVDAYFKLPGRMDAAAGTAYAAIPTIVVATHTDGTIHHFAGCYLLGSSNVPVGDEPLPDERDWFMIRASVIAVDDMNTAADSLDELCLEL